ncbi:hypothetical protein EVAR_47287_1 [Eumeta japonica]|uniref:Uncharacterized protein n=1 Tax=Eumeta variegata TaxID=151549 RepID=A0A4C1YWH1_EUMVA|nr:hypothetical protein EVAR_47287_1 [Eumeta japonica]
MRTPPRLAVTEELNTLGTMHQEERKRVPRWVSQYFSRHACTSGRILTCKANQRGPAVSELWGSAMSSALRRRAAHWSKQQMNMTVSARGLSLRPRNREPLRLHGALKYVFEAANMEVTRYPHATSIDVGTILDLQEDLLLRMNQ